LHSTPERSGVGTPPGRADRFSIAHLRNNKASARMWAEASRLVLEGPARLWRGGPLLFVTVDAQLRLKIGVVDRIYMTDY